MTALIALIEDDRYVRDSCAALVRSWGYAVAAFDSAEEFFAAPAAPRPGCVICDLRLGGMDGIELLERLRDREPLLPVILISAYADVAQAVRAMQLGASTVLEKPVPEEALRTGLARALQTSLARPKAPPLAGGGERLFELRQRRESLSEEEARVLNGLLAGKQNKQIAGELNIGLRTAELRRSTVMKKMGADSLAQLIRLAILLNGPAGEKRSG